MYNPYLRAYYQPNHYPLKDYGPNPLVINIEEVTEHNQAFRFALWTGNHLQVTLMSIPPGQDIGLEMHPDIDQLLCIVEGRGMVQMGDTQQQLTFQAPIHEEDMVIIPAKKWHQIINTGNRPLKLFSIYAPVQHPYGTIHQTKAIAQAQEHRYSTYDPLW